MLISIKSPAQSVAKQVDWLEIHTSNGSMVILPGHAPMVVALKPNSQITMMINGTKHQEQILQGIAHVTREGVTLLLN